MVLVQEASLRRYRGAWFTKAQIAVASSTGAGLQQPLIFRGPRVTLLVDADRVEVLWHSVVRRLLRRARRTSICRSQIAEVVLCPWGGVLLVVLKSGMIHSIVLSEAAGAAHAALQRV